MERIWWQRLTGEAKAEYEAQQQKLWNNEITEEESDAICDRLRAELEASERKPIRFNPKNGGGHWVEYANRSYRELVELFGSEFRNTGNIELPGRMTKTGNPAVFS